MREDDDHPVREPSSFLFYFKGNCRSNQTMLRPKKYPEKNEEK